MNDMITLDFIIIAIIAFVTGILFRRWVRIKANKRKLERGIKQGSKK